MEGASCSSLVELVEPLGCKKNNEHGRVICQQVTMGFKYLYMGWLVGTYIRRLCLPAYVSHSSKRMVLHAVTSSGVVGTDTGLVSTVVHCASVCCTLMSYVHAYVCTYVHYMLQ